MTTEDFSLDLYHPTLSKEHIAVGVAGRASGVTHPTDRQAIPQPRDRESELDCRHSY